MPLPIKSFAEMREFFEKIQPNTIHKFTIAFVDEPLYGNQAKFKISLEYYALDGRSEDVAVPNLVKVAEFACAMDCPQFCELLMILEDSQSAIKTLEIKGVDALSKIEKSHQFIGSSLNFVVFILNKVVVKNKDLEDLSLSGLFKNSVDDAMEVRSLAKLVGNIANLSQLKKLSLAANDFGNRDLFAMFLGTLKKSAIKELDIGDVNITTDSMAEVFKLIDSNSNIRLLNLSNFQLSKEVFETFYNIPNRLIGVTASCSWEVTNLLRSSDSKEIPEDLPGGYFYVIYSADWVPKGFVFGVGRESLVKNLCEEGDIFVSRCLIPDKRLEDARKWEENRVARMMEERRLARRMLGVQEFLQVPAAIRNWVEEERVRYREFQLMQLYRDRRLDERFKERRANRKRWEESIAARMGSSGDQDPQPVAEVQTLQSEVETRLEERRAAERALEERRAIIMRRLEAPRRRAEDEPEPETEPRRRRLTIRREPEEREGAGRTILDTQYQPRVEVQRGQGTIDQDDDDQVQAAPTPLDIARGLEREANMIRMLEARGRQQFQDEPPPRRRRRTEAQGRGDVLSPDAGGRS